MQKQTEAAPLTSCSLANRSARSWTQIFGLLALALLVFGGLTGCAVNRQVAPINLLAKEPSRFECKRADGTDAGEVKRPALPPEVGIVVSGDVASTTASVAAFMVRLREREGLIARYMLVVEGVNFVCANNMEWQRDVYKSIE